MVINKTSCLPRLCVRSIAATLELDDYQTSQMVQYVELLGAAFQIQDDLLDYFGNKKINYTEFLVATLDVRAFLDDSKLEALFS